MNFKSMQKHTHTYTHIKTLKKGKGMVNTNLRRMGRV